MDQKTSKLLEEDIKERPTVTLQERREYLRAVAVMEPSRSVICRAIARIGSSRKKQPCLESRAESIFHVSGSLA
jgi:hypothetical protein